MRQIICDGCGKEMKIYGFFPVRISFKGDDPSEKYEIDYCEECKTKLKKQLGIYRMKF